MSPDPADGANGVRLAGVRVRDRSLKRLRRRRAALDRAIRSDDGATRCRGCFPDGPTYRSAIADQLRLQLHELDRTIAARERASSS